MTAAGDPAKSAFFIQCANLAWGRALASPFDRNSSNHCIPAKCSRRLLRPVASASTETNRAVLVFACVPTTPIVNIRSDGSPASFWQTLAYTDLRVIEPGTGGQSRAISAQRRHPPPRASIASSTLSCSSPECVVFRNEDVARPTLVGSVNAASHLNVF